MVAIDTTILLQTFIEWKIASNMTGITENMKRQGHSTLSQRTHTLVGENHADRMATKKNKANVKLNV